MFNLVPTVQTTYSQLELCKGLIKVWYSEFNTVPSKASVGVILAQNAIETGGKYFWNNNLGNVKVGQDDPNNIIDYCMLRNVWEIENGKKVVYQPPARQTWFRSFPTLEDGIKFHLQLLRNNRYKVAWPAVESGDVALFARLLRQQGYYTASEKDYINGMMVHFNSYKTSGNYERAIAEFKQSFDNNLDEGDPVDNQPLPDDSNQTVNDNNVIDDVVERRQDDIEFKGNFLALAFKALLDFLFSWIKPKS